MFCTFRKFWWEGAEKSRKYFTNKRISYECKYLEDCFYNCFDTSNRNDPIFDTIVQNSKNPRLEQIKTVLKGADFKRKISRKFNGAFTWVLNRFIILVMFLA